jgi:hypothetical protein
MSVAEAADARPRTKTRKQIALATALEEEEVKLLAAEEDTLLLRRSFFFLKNQGALHGVRERVRRRTRASKSLQNSARTLCKP